MNEAVNTLDKEFFNLDEAKTKYDKNKMLYKEQGVLWVINGYVAEGRKEKRHRSLVYYPKAGPYTVVPDLTNIEQKAFNCDQLGNIEIDLISCPVSVNKRTNLPVSFKGMSGGALWNVIYNFQGDIEDIVLVGLATIQDQELDRLVCQGPIALYDVFYPHVVKLQRTLL